MERKFIMKNSEENKIDITLTEMIEIGLLRSIAGFGLGLLLAEKFNERNRKTVGWTLFLGSIALGIPVGIRFFRKNKGVISK